MNLFFSPGACSFAPNVLLRELDIPFNLVKVDLKSKKTADGVDFLKVNPNGYVPALQFDDGTVLTEGVAVLQYLADQKPEKGLAPKFGTMERYRLMEMMNFLTTEVHKTYGILFGAAGFVKGEEGLQQLREAAKAKLAERFNRLADILKSQPYLMGANFTIADIYLVTILRWSPMVSVDLSKWKPLQDLIGRVQDRPSVQAAIKAEGLKG